jgi:hypothetical protein
MHMRRFRQKLQTLARAWWRLARHKATDAHLPFQKLHIFQRQKILISSF